LSKAQQKQAPMIAIGPQVTATSSVPGQDSMPAKPSGRLPR
jgi:hypothetical protein